MNESLAIVAMACRYPEAHSPDRLWRNVVRGRRAFRALPPERIDLASYARFGLDSLAIVPAKAGLITDWSFDRTGFRIPAAAYGATDLVHWLALETAVRSLSTFGGQLPVSAERTAVVVANTLTGEFSRATALGLRAPFLDGLLSDAAEGAGLSELQNRDLRMRFSAALVERLGEPNEETLAGGLANTIAGRIANYLDLKGGAFSVDGACASSLVALATAAEMLNAERVDAVLVGAVDLSLDPFELVGFSRVGALAEENMRVFDARAQGFWPGEGAAFVLLMRSETARAAGVAARATIRGWGLSTDGAGGLIRPSVEGQVSAIRRACAIGDTDPADLDFVEAHGTGTPTGDPVEVRALAIVRADARTALPIGSIKANIGHTKAAAGLAGLIKAVEALGHRTIPPHVSADIPHPVFAEVEGRVRISHEPLPLPEGRSGLAGVSSFGFGGVNAHIVIEGPAGASGPVRARIPRPVPRQDCELFLLATRDREELMAELSALHARAHLLSMSELGDAAAAVAAELGQGPNRVAIIATTPEELQDRCAAALARLDHPDSPLPGDVWFGCSDSCPTIGFLFPGQAAPVRPDGGAWAARFHDLPIMPVPARLSVSDTAYAQPAIAAASLAAIRILASVGIVASAALGHSLGELSALAWAGSLPDTALVPLARARGAAFQQHAVAGGGMLRLNADASAVRRLASGLAISIACENGPEETVAAGPTDALAILEGRARSGFLETIRLSVSHAFHHEHMAPAVGPFRQSLADIDLSPPQRPLISSVTGDWLSECDNIESLLCAQLTSPVRFHEALLRLGSRTSLLIEVGPGHALSRLARAAGFAAVSVDSFGPDLSPLLSTIAAAFVAGAKIVPSALFLDRQLEPFDRHRPPIFLENPCGRRATAVAPSPLEPRIAQRALDARFADDFEPSSSLLEIVRRAVAGELGLESAAVAADDRFDTRLHLSSLAVARIVARASRDAGAPMPRAPTEFAGATSRELADAIADLKAHGGKVALQQERIAGVRPWIRTLRKQWAPASCGVGASAGAWHRLRPGEALPAPAPPRLLIDARRLAPGDDALSLLFLSVREAAAAGSVRDLAVLAARQPISGFLRALAQEGGFNSVCLLDVESGSSEARVDEILSSCGSGFTELRLDHAGNPMSPLLGPVEPAGRTFAAIGPHDVIWVSGGARGIAAECALALARKTGAGLILSSRSPADSPDVAAVLARAREDGIRVDHARADVLDRAALSAALERATKRVGAPTILIHAAAVNRPARIADIDGPALSETLAPKVEGLENAIAAGGSALKRIYAFGSIIGCLGLAGETHYALANAMMVDRLGRYALSNPNILALAVEWSVWGGVGMGEALGVVERLQADGVDPLGVDEAIAMFLSLVETGADGDVVITSRFGPSSDLVRGLPLAEAPRFLDQVLVHTPGIELVTQTRLWPGRDRALVDHRVDGTMILPGVMSLEAMAQVSSLLVGRRDVAEITSVRFSGAIAVADGATVELRIASLVRKDGIVDAAIRSSEDSFATERASASFRFDARVPSSDVRPIQPEGADASVLYGPMFFHGPRFQRVRQLAVAGSRQVTAWLDEAPEQPWFAAHDHEQLVLGDPAARDAALHALQVLVSHRRVVPVSVGRIGRWSGGAIRQVEAQERCAEPGRYVFDILCRDAAGQVVERWEGAEFRSLGSHDPIAALRALPILLGPALERVAREMLNDGSLELRIGTPDPPGLRRTDGRPLDPRSSRSRGALGLTVSSDYAVGCDLEWESSFAVNPPPRIVIAVDGAGIGAGQAWVAGEALRKIGQRPPAQIARVRGSQDTAMAQLYQADGALVLVACLPAAEGQLLAAIAETRPGTVHNDDCKSPPVPSSTLGISESAQ